MLAQLSQDDDVRLVAVRGGIGAVPGVQSAGVHAGIKPRKRDLARDHVRAAAGLRVGHHHQ